MLLGIDKTNSQYTIADGVIGSTTVVAMNTMTDLSDIGAEQLIKVTQRDRPQEKGNFIAAGKNKRNYYVDTLDWRYFAIGFAHNNPGSFTATPLLNESYVYIEFVRGL